MTSSGKFCSALAQFSRSEEGWVMVWSMFFLLALALAGGLTVDFANGIRRKMPLQVSVDAAALAAVIDLPDSDAATLAGMDIAESYIKDGALTIEPEDFVYGKWDTATGTFDPDATPFDAVRVTAGRETSRGNAVSTYLLPFAGVGHFDINVSALARSKSDQSCKGGGFFSNQKVNSGSNNGYKDNFCLYGRTGVKIGSDNSFDPGVDVVMPNLALLEQSSNNTGLAEALLEDDISLTMPGRVPTILAAMRSGTLSGMPGFITHGPVYLSTITDTTPLAAHTLYIVSDVASLGSNRSLANIAIVAQKEVMVGCYVTLNNLVFASSDKVLFGSNNTIGLAGYCASGKYSANAFSPSNIEFGSNTYRRGMQFAAQGMIKLGSDVAGAEGVYAESLGDLEYGSADVLGGCPNGLASDFGASPVPGGGGVKFAQVK